MPRTESDTEKTSRAPAQAPEPIAIVGIGLRFPGGSNSPDEFDAFLREGRSGIGPIPGDRWDVAAFTPDSPEDKGKIHTSAGGFLDRIDQFDASFFNISPKEAQYMDPQQRMLLETTWQALEHANIDPTPLRRGNGGVYIGASSIDYSMELDSLPYEELEGNLASGITMFPLSGRLSYFLGWRGPSMSIDTACSSSLVALHLAVQGLRAGESDIALCGGVNALHHPRTSVMFSNAQMLSPDGQCKTFDEAADGYARAEGCGVVVLKRLSDATRDGDTVLALVRGTAVGQDGDSAGLTVPNGPAQEKVIRAALAAGRLAPEDIQYVEAHGTGTPLGDPIEFGAIGDAFADSHTSDDPLLVGSVKTNLGHMEPAAGIVGVIKTVLQMRSGTIYPHLNFDTPSGRIPWDLYPVRVPTACEPWKAEVRRAVVNSFGFAGTIGAVVLEQAPAPAGPAPADPPPHGVPMFTLSAKSAAALSAQAQNYRQLLDERPDVGLDELCYTANVSRTHHPYRVAGPVTDRTALTSLLDKAAGEKHEGPTGIRRTAFMFSGQGSQYAGMGAALYERFPVFREHVDRCDELFAPHLGRSVAELVLGTAADPEAIDRTEYTQPALFTLEYALAKLWMSWGVRPNVLIGHSIGEVVAAAVAGLFDLPDAVTLVAARARLMQAVSTPGGMAAVSAPAEDVEPLLAGHPDLALAAVNAPDQCVVSGGTAALDEIIAVLKERGTRVDRLAVSHAFHSPLMAEVYDDFRAAIDGITFHEPAISLISNATGRPARLREIGTVDYWVRHIGEPVRFMAGIRAVAQRGRHALIEIGPQAALTALARRCLTVEDHVWLASLRRRDSSDGTTLAALAGYYAAGLTVSWADYHADRPAAAKTSLPTYAFQRKRYWLPSVRARRTGAAGGTARHLLLGTEERFACGVREFTAEFTPEDLGALTDLGDGERTTLPTGAYIDLFLALQDAVMGHTRAAVRELKLLAPLHATAETVTVLTSRWRPHADGGADVQVFTLVGGEEHIHATATIAAEREPVVPVSELAELDAGLTPAGQHIDDEDIYTDLASVGRPHGPRMRLLLRASRHRDGLVTGELTGRDATAVEHAPAELLEAAVQAAVVLDPEGPVFEPREIASVRHFRKPRGEQLRVLARVHGDHDRRVADILLLENGDPVTELLGVRLARPGGRQGRRQFLHRPEWVRRALPAQTAPAGGRHLLLLDQAAGRAAAPAGQSGLQVTSLPDTTDLKAALDDPTVTDVCRVWRQRPGAMSAERMRAECEDNYRELLALVTAMDAAGQPRPPRLWLVTEGAQALPGDPAGDGGHLAAATLWGFGRVLLTEYPQYRATLVDLAPGSDLEPLLSEWTAETPGEYQVAHRPGRRYVRRLLAGDATLTWSGGYELRAPDSGDLSDLALVPAADRAPDADEVQIEVRAVALTDQDARTALDTGRAEREDEETPPVLGTQATGTVRAVGEGAGFTEGDEVLVRHDGTLRSTLTVPSASVVLAPHHGPHDGSRHFRLDETGEALRTALTDPAAEVWLSLPGARADAPAAPPADAEPVTDAAVRPDRTYIVTGGLGGLGLVTARKLVALGARHLTLVSRSGKPTEEAGPVLAELAESAELALVRADVSLPEDVRTLVDEVEAGSYPVGGVVHAAGSYDKKLIAELTWESIDAQLAAKAYGGWLLHEAAQSSFPELEFFVTYSSIASVLGGATQGHYAAASAGLDSLAEWRTRQGLPGLSVNWGAWARVGMSARLEEHLSREIERSGVRFFSPTRALDTLARLWGGRPRTQRVVGEFDWDRYVAGSATGDQFYDRLARQDGAADDGFDAASLGAMPTPDRRALITQVVRDKVVAVLQMEADDELDESTEFVSLGLDSLMAQNVKSGLEQVFRLPLAASITFDHPTVRQLADFLDGQLCPVPTA
ncbi:SDR family oxidoreductase [Streptomyces sp. NPDC005752]|uniref:SDR family oxidoreductase n=1 Tax=Streptomyces sp. NPDC005752 TaxID=3157065 RepID=UPI0033EC55F1